MIRRTGMTRVLQSVAGERRRTNFAWTKRAQMDKIPTRMGLA